jgi:hypothetical protein
MKVGNVILHTSGSLKVRHATVHVSFQRGDIIFPEHMLRHCSDDTINVLPKSRKSTTPNNNQDYEAGYGQYVDMDTLGFHHVLVESINEPVPQPAVCLSIPSNSVPRHNHPSKRTK